MKEIKIGSKKYKIDCHASCYREYDDIFKRNIMQDIRNAFKFMKNQFELSTELLKDKSLNANDINQKVFDATVEQLDDFINCITKLCWICIHDVDSNIEDYDYWFKSLKRLSISDDWIMEVLGLCADCFC